MTEPSFMVNSCTEIPSNQTTSQPIWCNSANIVSNLCDCTSSVSKSIAQPETPLKVTVRLHRTRSGLSFRRRSKTVHATMKPF